VTGFLVGLVQMVVALFWENVFSLRIAGALVGLVTNFLSIKWIFAPIDPKEVCCKMF